MEEARGAVRWAFDFERWQPTEEEWCAALDLVSAEEQARIGRFKRPTRHAGVLVGRSNPDAKSALVGRLLILLAASRAFPHQPLDALRFGRTPQGKPFFIREDAEEPRLPLLRRFNFNVSHAGDWVVLAAESTDLVGVDVMKVELRGSNPSLDKFFHDMRTCFTTVEWDYIRGQQDDEPGQLDRFFRHWTLKEAYIKAIGIGLGFDLQRAEFQCHDEAALAASEIGGRRATATVRIDGAQRPEWTFELEYLDAQHIVTVARGPFAQALESYKACVGADANEEEARRQGDGRIGAEEEEEEVEEQKERPYRTWQVWTFADLMHHINERRPAAHLATPRS